MLQSHLLAVVKIIININIIIIKIRISQTLAQFYRHLESLLQASLWFQESGSKKVVPRRRKCSVWFPGDFLPVSSSFKPGSTTDTHLLQCSQQLCRGGATKFSARSSFAVVVQYKVQDEDKDLAVLYLQHSFQGRDEVAQRCSLASGQEKPLVIHCVGVEPPRDGVGQPLTQCHRLLYCLKLQNCLILPLAFSD